MLAARGTAHICSAWTVKSLPPVIMLTTGASSVHVRKLIEREVGFY